MFDYIRGPTTLCPPDIAVVEAGGLGYKVFVPHNVFPLLPPSREEVKLYLSVIVREYGQSLYGFLQLKQRAVFEVALSISGVGPKVALAIVGHLSLEELREALYDKRPEFFSRVPGVGKKTAERLVMELKDKVLALLGPIEKDQALPFSPSEAHPQVRDAVSALTNLGYQAPIAERVIRDLLKRAEGPIELPALITQALSRL